MSRPLAGSSSTSSFASATRARASRIRARSPSEHVAIFRSASPAAPTRASASRARPSSASSTEQDRPGETGHDHVHGPLVRIEPPPEHGLDDADLAPDLVEREAAELLSEHAARAPELGRVRADAMRIRVVFPAPFGPSTTHRSPPSTRQSSSTQQVGAAARSRPPDTHPLQADGFQAAEPTGAALLLGRLVRRQERRAGVVARDEALLREPAAVDDQGGAVDVRAELAREVQRRVRDVPRLAVAALRNRLARGSARSCRRRSTPPSAACG